MEQFTFSQECDFWWVYSPTGDPICRCFSELAAQAITETLNISGALNHVDWSYVNATGIAQAREAA